MKAIRSLLLGARAKNIWYGAWPVPPAMACVRFRRHWKSLSRCVKPQNCSWAVIPGQCTLQQQWVRRSLPFFVPRAVIGMDHPGGKTSSCKGGFHAGRVMNAIIARLDIANEV